MLLVFPLERVAKNRKMEARRKAWKASRNDGGKDILDIVARNEAITVTWLQSLLNFGEDRATWTYFADAILAHHAPDCPNESEEFTRMNMYLQSWKAKTRALPKDLKEMVNTGAKYGLRLEGLAFKRETMREMPLWLHPETDRRRRLKLNQKESECLRDTHGVRTVGDAEIFAKCKKLTGHKKNKRCKCNRCEMMRHAGCQNPNRCMQRAETLLGALPPKWNPLHEQPEDREIPPPKETEADKADPQKERVFNRNLTDQGSIADAFRIFTTGRTCNELPVPKIEWERSEDGDQQNETQTVYTDGGCTKNGDDDARASAGVWFGTNDPRNEAIRLPEELGRPSNQLGEIIGAYRATISADESENLAIKSDSRTTLEAVTKYSQKNEDKGWTGVADAHALRALTASLRERTGETTLQWVKGHAGIEGNEEADALATEGLAKETPDKIQLEMNPTFTVTGAKLKTLTQAMAYKAIKIAKMRTAKKKGSKTYKKQMNRPRTNANLDRARFAAKDLGERVPSNKLLWKGTRHNDFSKPVRYFLWMIMHDAYKIGSWWESKPGLEHRGKCNECGSTESMEHILFQCQAPGQRETWELVGKLWQKKNSKLIELNFENLLAVSFAAAKSEDDEEIMGDTRLLRIAITEAAHLIWKLRNERVIQDEEDRPKTTKKEIKNRLLYALNDRLQLDQAAIRKKKKPRQGGISPKVMMATWQGTLENEWDLPPDWSGETGVLVGIAS